MPGVGYKFWRRLQIDVYVPILLYLTLGDSFFPITCAMAVQAVTGSSDIIRPEFQLAGELLCVSEHGIADSLTVWSVA
jgi:hypothetical protein